MNRTTVAVTVGCLITVSTLVAITTRARAHDWYAPECCSGKDCAPIAAKFVTEEADGYHVRLPPGSHPMLRTKGYDGVIPYSSVKDSQDGAFHICLSDEGVYRFCFFAGPRLG